MIALGGTPKWCKEKPERSLQFKTMTSCPRTPIYRVQDSRCTTTRSRTSSSTRTRSYSLPAHQNPRPNKCRDNRPHARGNFLKRWRNKRPPSPWNERSDGEGDLMKCSHVSLTYIKIDQRSKIDRKVKVKIARKSPHQKKLARAQEHKSPKQSE